MMTGPPTQAALIVSACIALCKSQPEKSGATRDDEADPARPHRYRPVPDHDWPVHINRTRWNTATTAKITPATRENVFRSISDHPTVDGISRPSVLADTTASEALPEEPGTAVPTGRLCRRGRWQPDESLCRHFQQWAQRSRSVVIWCWMTVPRGRKERRLLWRGTSIPRAKRRQNLLWMCSGRRAAACRSATQETSRSRRRGLSLPRFHPNGFAKLSS